MLKKGIIDILQRKKNRKIPSLSRSELNYLHSEMCNWKQIDNQILHSTSCPGYRHLMPPVQRSSDHIAM